MADKSTQLILDALSRAVAEPVGLPLFGSKAAGGLFTSTAAAKQAAQRSKDESLLQVVRVEKRGRNDVEICTITEKGIAFLLNQVSPKPVLEELVRAVEARQQQVNSLVAAAQQTQTNLDMLRAVTEKVLQTLHPPALPLPSRNGKPQGTNGHPAQPAPPPEPAWPGRIMPLLHHWQATHPTEDCSLPELYRQLCQAGPAPTVGEFHDALRQLHEQGRIYLHPWTGPLYDLPEPSLALLVGHEVAYYVSVRK